MDINCSSKTSAEFRQIFRLPMGVQHPLLITMLFPVQ